ncbi:MAG: DUF4367 domain-containing protein [Oscillospiraceae bacterium]
MIKKTLSTFEEVLLDSTLLEFAGVPSEEDIEYSFSEGFEQKAKKLIKKSGTAAWHCVNTTAKKLLIAAIITALLVSSAMAIPPVREELLKFFAHNTGVNYYFTVDEDAIKNAPKELEIVYSPSYVPDGYELVDETVCSGFASFTYLSPDGDLLDFTQEKMPDDPNYAVGSSPDAERSKVDYVEIKGYKVIQLIWDQPGDEAVSLIWTNEDYFFSIFCTAPVTLDEAKQIFYGIQPDEARTAAYQAERDKT